jgi:hypothetical protein
MKPSELVIIRDRQNHDLIDLIEYRSLEEGEDYIPYIKDNILARKRIGLPDKVLICINDEEAYKLIDCL